MILFGRVLGLLFTRIGIQSMLGEIAAGIGLGIFLLWIGLPLTTPSLEVFSQMGILILMLLAGLMTDFRLFSNYKKESTAVGTGGVLVSFGMVFVVMLWINNNILGIEGVGATTSALFVAVLLSNTAIEVCARIFLTGGSKREKVRTTIIGASFIDDILAVFLIGIVSSMVLLGRTPSPYEVVILSLKVAAFLLISLFFVGKMVEKIFDSFLKESSKRERLPFTATILLAFGMALMARPFGLHEVIGAYMAGLMIGKWGSAVGPMLKRHLVWKNLLREIDPLLRAVFSPLFFGFVGLFFIELLRPDEGVSFTVMGIAAVLLVFALASKIIGCGGSAAVFGFSRDESLLVGTGMMGRGALEMALLIYGLQAGIINEILFSAVVLVTIGTIIATPLLYSRVETRIILKEKEFGAG